MPGFSGGGTESALTVRIVTLPVAAALIILAGTLAIGSQPAQPPAGDLFTRVGLTAEEAATARSGQRVVRELKAAVDTELAVAGAIRIRGAVDRLAAWLGDIEQFRRSLGADVMGTIDTPARAENFSGLSPAEADQLLSRAAAYQRSGNRTDDQFNDMLRRAAQLWQLAYPFAVYLEEFPASRPAGVDDRFYWTRETGRNSVLTLHHVVLERLPDKSLRLADKQFYASRDIDTALLVGQATPAADGNFDLIVVLRARVPKLGSIAARALRGRVSREITDSFGMYLDWLKQSFALG